MHKSLFIAWLILVSNTLLANSDNNTVVWSKDKTALAFCNYEEELSCFVVCNDMAVEVSAVERSNLGKLGKNTVYEKVMTYPSQWESNNKKSCIVWFATIAWRDGQRYTVKELVYIANGKYDGR